MHTIIFLSINSEKYRNRRIGERQKGELNQVSIIPFIIANNNAQMLLRENERKEKEERKKQAKKRKTKNKIG